MSSTKQQKGLTSEECKRILFKVGMKLGVSPKLISTRLLSAQDKCDMLNGDMSIASLEAAVTAWKANGMPDHANGRDIPLEHDIKTGLNRPLAQPEQEKTSLRPPFVDFSETQKD